MRKYITILLWSNFFIFFMGMCCTNMIMGSLILSNLSLGFYFVNLLTYLLLILFIPHYYENFYKPQNNMKVLMIIPVPFKNIAKLQKISMCCMTFIPALLLTCILLFHHNPFGFTILPNYLLVYAVYYLIKKLDDDENFLILLFIFGVLPLTILFLIEMKLIGIF